MFLCLSHYAQPLWLRRRYPQILGLGEEIVLIARIDDEKPEGVENEAVEQIAFADRVLLNKTDLVGEAELPAIEERLKKSSSVKTKTKVAQPMPA